MLIASRLDLKYIKTTTASLLSCSALPLPSDGEVFTKYFSVLPTPWKSALDIENAHLEIKDLYEEVLDLFVKCLNKVHEVEMSKRFWRILIGPWLLIMTAAVYERYNRLKSAKEVSAGPLLSSDNSDFNFCIKNTLEFVDLINYSEKFNLKITTEVAKIMGYPVMYTQDDEISQDDSKPINPTKYRRSIKLRVYDQLMKLFCRYGNVFLHNTGHSKNIAFSLFVKSWGNIVDLIVSTKKSLDNAHENIGIRNKFEREVLIKTKHFQSKLLLHIISTVSSKFMPKCWLESYKFLEKDVIKNYPTISKTKKIVSSTSWHYDEWFKLWAAHCSVKGAKLIGVQHGGNYGILKCHTSEKHETDISDYYLTWGWTSDDKTKYIPCTAPKINDLKKRNFVVSECNIRNKILFVATSGCRFLIDFSSIPDSFLNYHANQIEFFSNLTYDMQKKLVVRLHKEDKIWEIKERLLMKFPDLRFENNTMPFNDSIHRAKIVIFDHLSTTFSEALVSNIPCLLFWNNEQVLIRHSAKKYFEEFKKVGILHESAKEAAKFLAKIENNVDKWWNSEELQTVLQNFCKNFAYQSSNQADNLYRILQSKLY